MPNNRLPRVFYNKLKELDSNPEATKIKCNWVTRIKQYLLNSKFPEIWTEQDPALARERCRALVEDYRLRFVEDDLTRIERSSYSTLYKRIKHHTNAETYLQISKGICKARMISQVRVASDLRLKIHTREFRASITLDSNCPMCGGSQKESIEHIVHVCPTYDQIREEFATKTGTLPNIYNLLVIENAEQLQLSYNFFICCFKRRSEITDTA